MNGVDVAQNRATLPQSFFYEPPRRDDEQQQPAPAPPQQQTTPQQPAFAAGYDAHAQDQPQSNPEGDGDDSDDQLSVQTLNADGTPKRPMNAFLLYAKKRRPQISTNHPTMRTGEISKVLSKEWQTMAKSEKQYYQDKAKKLKDTFNLRWPDYVYKRRPNNSRKKRRGIPNTDSPVVEDPSRRDSEGAENDGYGDGSGGDDAEGSPSLVVRVPHDRHPDEVRMGMPYGSGPAPQGDPRAPPPPTSGPPINSRMPYPPNPGAPGGYGYDDQYNQYPYYANNGSSAPPNRLPPVWNQHDASRSPYDTPRSASTGYSPVGGEDGQQQWQAGRPGNPSPITTSWQTPMHGGPQNPAQGVPAARGAPGVVGQRSSADNSPIQPSSDFRGANRPPPTPQSAGAGRSFQTLNAPMYPPAAPGAAAPRPGSPSAYNNATYPYSGQGGPASATGNGNAVGRSPVLPGVTSLDHGYGSHQQPSSNMRGDSGYSPMLPPLGASGDGRSASNPYPSPREGPSRQPGADADRAGRPDGRDSVAANGLSHPSYWDPVKSEAGE